MKVNKAKLNYFVDLIIRIGFLPTAVSGVVFLFAGAGGYQGGRNPRYMTQILFLSREVWNDVHTWGSLVIGGVALHDTLARIAACSSTTRSFLGMLEILHYYLFGSEETEGARRE